MDDDPRPNSDPDPEIADASLLFGEPDEPRPTPPIASEPDDADAYAIEGPEPEPLTDPTPIVPPVPPPQPRPAKPKSPKPAPRPASSGVDQVWSRGAEWGGSLSALGIGMVAVGTLLYATFSLDALALWAFLLLASLVVLALLAYPIFITLERPVRVTPEQAVKDYFGALSHRSPHFKRMWLLLATDGRNCPAFRSFPEFQSYWKSKLSAWKAASGSGWLNPIVVEVVDFKSDKSAGQSEIEASYTARVLNPSSSPDTPIETHRVDLRLVRGPDKMWYLDAGTLP